MAAFIIQLAWCAAFLAAFSADPPQIEPSWRCRAAADLLWLELDPAPGSQRAIALDATGGATVLNLRSGAAIAELRLTTGARVAGWTENQVLLFDRHSVAAIRVDTAASQPTAALDWSIGAPPAPQPDRDADPEFTTRLIAAAVARGLVLALRSDGELAAYDTRDGALRWRLSLNSGAEARLFPPVIDAHPESDWWWGAVSWRSGGVSRAAIWYSQGANPPTIETFETGTETPIWQGLARNELVTAQRAQIVTKSVRGRPLEAPLPDGVALATARIGMRDPRPWQRRSSPPPLEGGPALFVASESGEVVAIDAGHGTVFWRTTPPDEPRLGPVERVVMAADDPLLLSAIGWRRLRYRDGVVQHATVADGRLLHAGGASDETLGVFASQRAAGGVELQAVVQSCDPARPAQHVRLSGAFRAPRVLSLRPTTIVLDGAEVSAFELPR